MRAPVYRNLDSPLSIAGFSPGELIGLSAVFVGAAELCEFAAVPRAWALAGVIGAAVLTFRFRRVFGERFGARLLRHLGLPGRLGRGLLTSGRSEWGGSPKGRLGGVWDVSRFTPEGLMFTPRRGGFLLELDGLDGSFLSAEQRKRLHDDWRSVLRMDAGDELQIVLRKRVEFAAWIEDQLRRSFLADHPYGRRVLLDHLSDQIANMKPDIPRLLSQKIFACYWAKRISDEAELTEKRRLIQAQFSAFGFSSRALDRAAIVRAIHASAQDLSASERQEPEWPEVCIEAGELVLNGKDVFRAAELTRLAENATALGMAVGALTGAVVGREFVHHGQYKQYEARNTIISSIILALAVGGALAWHYEEMEQQTVEISGRYARYRLCNPEELNPELARALGPPGDEQGAHLLKAGHLGKLAIGLDDNTKWVYPVFRRRYLQPERGENQVLSSRYIWEILRPGSFVTRSQNPDYFAEPEKQE